MLSTRTFVAHFLYVAFLSLVTCRRLVRTGRMAEVWAFGAHRTHMRTGRMPADVGQSRSSGALSVCIIELSYPGCRVSTVVCVEVGGAIRGQLCCALERSETA